MFKAPKYEETPVFTSGNIEDGDYDFSLTGIEVTKNPNTGDDQISFTYTCDVGDQAGKTVRDMFTFSEKGASVAFSKLKAFNEAAGHADWPEDAKSIEEFASHWAVPGLRVHLTINSTYVIREGGSNKYVSKEEWERYDGPEENKRIYPNVRDYAPAEQETSLSFNAPSIAGKKQAQKARPPAARKSGSAPSGGDQFPFSGGDDDEFPSLG